MTRIARCASITAAVVALGALVLAPNAGAQEAPLPMGRSIGDACTRSVAPPPPAAGQTGFPPPAKSTAKEPTKLVKVTDNVYAIVNVDNTVAAIGPYGGNVTIYLTDDGVLLVDSKNERMHDDIVSKVRSLTDAPIKYVVLTHNHGDHSGGSAEMEAIGATVISSAADRKRMADAGQPGLPQMAYEGHAEIFLGDKSVQLLEYCGHTRGDTVVYIPDERVVVSGDLVTTPDSIPQITSYADGGDWTDMVRSLNSLAKLDFDFLIAGHGPVLTKQQFLAHRDKVAAIRNRAQELVRAGKSRDEIAQTLTAEFNWGSGPAIGNLPGMMLELR